jgi:hypothetical protein
MVCTLAEENRMPLAMKVSILFLLGTVRCLMPIFVTCMAHPLKSPASQIPPKEKITC